VSALVGFRELLFSAELREPARLDSKAFRRNRKLPFPTLVAFFLSGLKASVQNELNAIYAHLVEQAI
jgi:hypothetical protein